MEAEVLALGPRPAGMMQTAAALSIQPAAAGRLYLGINDDNNFDNRGDYDVQIVTAAGR